VLLCDQLKENTLGKTCSTQSRDCVQILFGNPEWKRILGCPGRSWEYNIKMELGKIGCGSANWFHLAQGRIQWWILGGTLVNFFWLHKRRSIF
jgi:hypothetical protein